MNSISLSESNKKLTLGICCIVLSVSLPFSGIVGVKELILNVPLAFSGIVGVK